MVFVIVEIQIYRCLCLPIMRVFLVHCKFLVHAGERERAGFTPAGGRLTPGEGVGLKAYEVG